jgi:DNA modification methylase
LGVVEGGGVTGRTLVTQADARRIPLADKSVHSVVTSPPYFNLRDYGVVGQIGLEATLDQYLDVLVGVFAEVKRILRDDGTLWLNIGDSYAGSWGAQSQPGGTLSANQVEAAPKQTNTGSMKKFRAGNPEKNGGNSNRDGLGPVVGLKPKDLVGAPWRLALALQADGWYLRSDIIWSKPNPMPESVTDRPTKAHEYLFLLTKSERYFYDADAVKTKSKNPSDNRKARSSESHKGFQQTESARMNGGSATYELANLRSVWTIQTHPFKGAHFATMPKALVIPCILAGSPEGGLVFDPFGGAGTVPLVAKQLGRHGIMTELNPEYARMALRRIRKPQAIAPPVTPLVCQPELF